MNKSQNKSAQHPEPNPPKTVHDLHQAFADLAYSYGMLGRNISPERNHEALEDIIIDCESLKDVA